MYFRTVLFLAAITFLTSALAAHSCQPGRFYFDRKASEIRVKGISKATNKVSIMAQITRETTEENLERTLVLAYAAIKRCSQDESEGRRNRMSRDEMLAANSQEAQDFAKMGMRMIQTEFERMNGVGPTLVDTMWSYHQRLLLLPLDALINHTILKYLPAEEHEAFEDKLTRRMKDLLRRKKSYLDDLLTGNERGSFWEA